jgi:hypothetical protein
MDEKFMKDSMPNEACNRGYHAKEGCVDCRRDGQVWWYVVFGFCAYEEVTSNTEADLQCKKVKMMSKLNKSSRRMRPFREPPKEQLIGYSICSGKTK